MKAKKVIRYIPEAYMLLSVIYYWTLTPNAFNPVAIILILFLLFQIITRNKITGVIISSIFVLLNFYLILALLSELNEFPTFDSEAKKLALWGFSYLILNITMGASMLYLYLKDLLKNSNIISEVK